MYAYGSEFEGSRLLTLLNFSDRDQSLGEMESTLAKRGRLLIGNYADGEGADPESLRPYEARVYLA